MIKFPLFFPSKNPTTSCDNFLPVSSVAFPSLFIFPFYHDQPYGGKQYDLKERGAVRHGFPYTIVTMKIPLWAKKAVSKNKRLANFLKGKYDQLAFSTTQSGKVTVKMMERLAVVGDLANIAGTKDLERIEISSHTVVAVMKDDTRFFIRPDQSVTSCLLYDGSLEEAETDLARKTIKKGWIVLDAGANFGWYASHFSKYVGDEGRVLAFEPIPSTFKELEDNIELNHVTNAILVNQALGSQEGEADFFVPRQFRGSGGTSQYNYFGDKVSVKITTLDAAMTVHRMERLDFIKADIEGGELGLLLGGRKTIERFHPHISMEVEGWHTERFGYKPKDIFSLLSEWGYLAFDIAPDRKSISEFDFKKFPEGTTGNYYFQHPESPSQ